MAFKLGSEKRGIKSSENVSFANKTVRENSNMAPGVIAQANNDGSIDVDPNVDLNSSFGKKVMKHELKHKEQMEEGRADYGDNWVMWEGKIYIRKDENGEPIIDGPNGKWPEGHPNHPWEAEAIQAETE
tara:strand:+ start:915 stop:1301 length:387 start_codon:yes stop_codon:yes gene_type:complete